MWKAACPGFWAPVQLTRACSHFVFVRSASHEEDLDTIIQRQNPHDTGFLLTRICSVGEYEQSQYFQPHMLAMLDTASVAGGRRFNEGQATCSNYETYPEIIWYYHRPRLLVVRAFLGVQITSVKSTYSLCCPTSLLTIRAVQVQYYACCDFHFGNVISIDSSIWQLSEAQFELTSCILKSSNMDSGTTATLLGLTSAYELYRPPRCSTVCDQVLPESLVS